MSPQPRSIGQQRKDVRTHIDFCVRSPMLRLDEISRLLGEEPSYGWEAGASYIGRMKVGNEIRQVERQRPSFGVWHFDTSCFTSSDELEEHAVLLLDRFERCAKQIQRLMENPDYTVALIVWHVGPAGFALSSNVLSRLAAISHWMSFTCWETEDGTVDESQQGNG